MSETEKMYENAGLSDMWVERYNDGYYEHERYYNSYREMINNMMKVNDWTLSEAQEVAKRECRKEHPPFTAEKQIELIKWLAKKDYYTCDYCEIEPRKDGQEWLSYCHFKSWTSNTFEKALAGLINEMWQSLTEEEKQQVKGILE